MLFVLLFYFFLDQYFQGFINIFGLFKNQLFKLCWFYCMFVSISLISVLIYAVFLLLSLDLLCHSFPNFLRLVLSELVFSLFPFSNLYIRIEFHTKHCFSCILQVLIRCVFITIHFKIFFLALCFLFNLC